MSRDEQALQDLISCVKGFDCFPFDPASPALQYLQSAIPATPELIQDFKKAKQDGEAQLKKLSLIDNSSIRKKNPSMIAVNGIHISLCRDSIKESFWADTETRRNKEQGISICYNLADVSGLLSLPELMKHCISEECQHYSMPMVLSERLKRANLCRNWQCRPLMLCIAPIQHCWTWA